MASNDSTNWTSFEKHTAVFRILSNQQALHVDILLAPSFADGKLHPLVIAYHAGGLITGGRDQYHPMTPWLPPYAAEANAIILSPDHRLLPKASAREIRQDIDMLWKWVNSSLNSVLSSIAPGHEADHSRILVQGSSAGGFGAAHLALSYPEQIRAAILVYPMVDGFHERGLVTQTLFPPDVFPSKEELAEWIAEQKKLDGWIVERNDGPKFLMGLFQDQAAFSEAFGSDEDSSPAYRAAESGDAKGVPERVWILHGSGDSIIPAQYSQKFYDIMKSRGWAPSVRLTIVDNENSEHGFDHTWNIEEERLAKHLSWINESWLSVLDT